MCKHGRVEAWPTRTVLVLEHDPGDALRDISESVMREVVGDRTVDEVLTIGRQDIEANAQTKMQEVVNLYEMGLRIDQVQLKNVNPPKPVKASFDEVNEAQQERERMRRQREDEMRRRYEEEMVRRRRQQSPFDFFGPFGGLDPFRGRGF